MAARLTVTGHVDPNAVQRLAAAEHIIATPEGQLPPPRRLRLPLVLTGVSGALLLFTWVLKLPAPVYLVAAVLGGYATFGKGARALARGRFDMNGLMLVAVLGAVAIGEWSEAATVAFLYGVSEVLEAASMERARGAIRSLVQLAPRTARIRRRQAEMDCPVQDVQVGDILVVRPGERIAMDGEVTAGCSGVNQAAITGESVPAAKEPGLPVYAGTLNGEGALEVRVTRRVDDTTLARVIHLVEQAQGQRAPVQRFVEVFARSYTPAVLALAAILATVPPVFFGGEWKAWIYRALALVVSACPCALVISTPVAVVSAIGAGARHGVLIKGGAHLEAAGRIRAVALDKTGTLTAGEPVVTTIVPYGGQSESAVLALAAAVETRSEHPLARAVARAAARLEIPPATGFRAIPGRGATAVVAGQTVYAGSARLFTELGAPLPELPAGPGSVLLVGTATAVLGAIAVTDHLRPASAVALAELKELGVARVVMLTGDTAAAAATVAGQAGVDEVRAGLLPEDKVAAVSALRAEYGYVAMVGDGVNDAPALAAASLGIAMGGAGTDVALETADVALMADDLSKLPFLLRLGQSALAVIRQNIAFALGLKLLAVAAVFPGWLSLWLAIMADMGATILVTLNGIRLLRMRG